MKKFNKVSKLKKDTSQEIASELSQEIKQDAVANAERYSKRNGKGKGTDGVAEALKKEAEFID